MTLNDKYRQRLGEYLLAVRTAASKTQFDIARGMKLTSNQHVSNVERGKSAASMAYLKKFQRICNPDKNDFLVSIQQIHVDQIKVDLR